MRIKEMGGKKEERNLVVMSGVDTGGDFLKD